MSKIICDVCGTSYPETATQCPICGCVRPGDSQSILAEGDTEQAGSGGYTYVKGGRFSKANVKKRNKSKYGNDALDEEIAAPEEEKKENKGLVIAVLVLLLAIVAVAIYIVVRLFGTGSTPAPNGTTTDQTLQTTSSALIACTDIELSNSDVELTELGSAWMLNVTVEPADSTDEVIFTSEDPSVAQVDSKGVITAVGPGQTMITVKCGDITQQCRVTCSWEEETTEDTTEETTEETTVPVEVEGEIKLNRTDMTLSREGQTWNIYNGTVPVEAITWTSGDDTVATVENGVVTAVGVGRTTVYAEYNGEKLSCIVRCSWTSSTESTGIAGNGGGIGEDTGSTASGNYKIYSPWGVATDVTIKVGESLTLSLKDANGKQVTATWSVSDESVLNINGSTVTGVSKGKVNVIATYNGVDYYGIVFVS